MYRHISKLITLFYFIAHKYDMIDFCLSKYYVDNLVLFLLFGAGLATTWFLLRSMGYPAFSFVTLTDLG